MKSQLVLVLVGSKSELFRHVESNVVLIANGWNHRGEQIRKHIIRIVVVVVVRVLGEENRESVEVEGEETRKNSGGVGHAGRHKLEIAGEGEAIPGECTHACCCRGHCGDRYGHLQQSTNDREQAANTRPLTLSRISNRGFKIWRVLLMYNE